MRLSRNVPGLKELPTLGYAPPPLPPGTACTQRLPPALPRDNTALPVELAEAPTGAPSWLNASLVQPAPYRLLLTSWGEISLHTNLSFPGNPTQGSGFRSRSRKQNLTEGGWLALEAHGQPAVGVASAPVHGLLNSGRGSFTKARRSGTWVGVVTQAPGRFEQSSTSKELGIPWLFLGTIPVGSRVKTGQAGFPTDWE